MRLIDADKLQDKSYVEDKSSLYPKSVVDVEDIENEPTVEAIPIEWAKEWVKKHAFLDYFYAVLDMIADWEKETCNKLATNLQQEMEKRK